MLFYNCFYYNISNCVLRSPFSSKKQFKVPSKYINSNKSIVFEQPTKLCFDFLNRTCFFDTIQKLSWKFEYEIRQVFNQTNPYDSNLKGPAYKKYTHVMVLRTIFFTSYFYLVKKDLPLKNKKIKICPLEEISLRCTFIINKDDLFVYRLLKVEEFDLITITRNEIDYFYEDSCDVIDKSMSIIKSRYFKKQNPNKNIARTICFDIETIEYKGILVPFIIYAKEGFYDESSLLDVNYAPAQNFCWKYEEIELTDRLYMGSRLFSEWLYNICVKLCIQNDCIPSKNNPCYNNFTLRLFGFNNHNFDNHLIFNDMRYIFRKFKYNFNTRFGKTTSIEFSNYGFKLTINDLTTWFPNTSLSKACKDYSIQMAKYDVDIVAYCKNVSLNKKILREINNCELDEYLKETNDFDNEFKNQYIINNKFQIYNLIVDYCIRDVEATIELHFKLNSTMQIIFNELKELNINVPSFDIFYYISPPQLAFYILRELLVEENEPILKFNDENYNKFIYECYRGGRCSYTCIGEVFPTGEDGEFLYVDVTSEYPTAMNALFPSVKNLASIYLGEDINIEKLNKMLEKALELRNELFDKKILHTTFEWSKEINQIKGFFDCCIEPPNDIRLYSTWAPVGTRIQFSNTFKLIFCNFKQDNARLCTADFCSLILAGWKIKINPNKYNILFTEQDYITRKYISIIGEKKTKNTNNKTLRNFYKLMLNSLYGKLAQKPKHIIHKQTFNNYSIQSNEKLDFNDWSSSYHYLGAYITAYSNYIIFQHAYFAELELIYQYAPLEARTNICLYTDTDSIIINKNKISSFLKFQISEEIGTWNEEKNNFNVNWKFEDYGKPIKSMFIIAKKSYFLMDKDKNLICLKAKGIHDKIIKTITYDLLKTVLDDKPWKVSFEGLSKKSKNLTDNNFGIKTDIIKDIYSTILKKTLTRDHISKEETIYSNDKLDLEVNYNNLNKTFYKTINNINIYNYLIYTTSILKPELLGFNGATNKSDESSESDGFITRPIDEFII